MEKSMKYIFRIDRFIDWLYLNGSTPHQVDKMLNQFDWGRYDGMTYEEVCKTELYVIKDWFTKEETK